MLYVAGLKIPPLEGRKNPLIFRGGGYVSARALNRAASGLQLDCLSIASYGLSSLVRLLVTVILTGGEMKFRKKLIRIRKKKDCYMSLYT